MALLCFHMITIDAVYFLQSTVFNTLKKIQKKFSCMQGVKVIPALIGLNVFAHSEWEAIMSETAQH